MGKRRFTLYGAIGTLELYPERLEIHTQRKGNDSNVLKSCERNTKNSPGKVSLKLVSENESGLRGTKVTAIKRIQRQG